MSTNEADLVGRIERERNSMRMIAIDLLDEILSEDPFSHEHGEAQADALMNVGDDDSIDPKTYARVLLVKIADRLSDASS